MTGRGNSRESGSAESKGLPVRGIRDADAFRSAVLDIADRVAHPTSVSSALSRRRAAVGAERHARACTSQDLCGGDRASPTSRGSNRVGLRFAARDGPAPSESASYDGLGFFTEGDNQTGVWNEQKGYFWTGSFWPGELWQLYSYTHDERYAMGRALDPRLVGNRAQEPHDTGFLNLYSVRARLRTPPTSPSIATADFAPRRA